MREADTKPLRRDLARTILLIAGLVTLLGSAAAGGRWHRELCACYYAARLVRDADPWWCRKLEGLGPAAAPACRLGYRLSSNEGRKCLFARILADCAGLEALHDFVECTGFDSPAGEFLASCLTADPADVLRLPGAELLERGPGKPSPFEYPPTPDSLPHREVLEVRYTFGNYLVTVYTRWGRRYKVGGGGNIPTTMEWGPWFPCCGRAYEITRRDPLADPPRYHEPYRVVFQRD